MAESRKTYAEDKEAEVKLLERSVEELECTINVLENKVRFCTMIKLHESTTSIMMMFNKSQTCVRLTLSKGKLNINDYKEGS